MKKFFVLLLTALLCLSFAACGDQPVDDPGSDVQQNDGGEQTPTLEEILCNDNWYYVGLRTPVGLDFNADGTISGGTWTLNGTTLDCVWKNGTTTRFELRDIYGSYFMTDEEGITLYHYGTKPDWNVLDRMAVQVVTANWEEYLEVVFHEDTLKYRLQLKKQYMQGLYAGGDTYLDISYSQVDQQELQASMYFDPSGYYIEIENPAEIPLEILGVNGVLEILTDLM